MQLSHDKLPANFKSKPGTTYAGLCACGRIYVTVNTDEIFVRIGKAGGCASALNESVGKLASHFLQKGGDLNVIVKSLCGVSCHSANSTTPSCISVVGEILKEHIKGGK